MARGWVGTIAPADVVDLDEDGTRREFQDGHGVFIRHWPYVWALVNVPGNSLRGKVGIARLPGLLADGPRASTLGGWSLAVSRYSKNQKLAVDLVRFLTSESEQRRRSLQSAYYPTIGRLYRDPDVVQVNPFLADWPLVKDIAVRPAQVLGSRYVDFSRAFSHVVHETLSGHGSAEFNLGRLEQWNQAMPSSTLKK